MSTSLVRPSAALAALVGEQPMARAKVTQRVWAHIERQSLRQRSGRARWVLLDDVLRAALCTMRDEIAMYDLAELLDTQLTPAPIGAAPGEGIVKTKAKRNGKKPAPSMVLSAPAPAITLRVGDCVPHPGLNARTYFDPAETRDLAASIARQGMLQPLVLHEDGDQRFVVAGERRWKAAMLLGEDTIVPATVRAYTDAELVEIMLVENLHRKDLRPIEEARGFAKALALEGMTQRELAARVNRSQPYISNAIRLLELPDVLLAMIDEGKLAPSIARDVLLPFMAVPEPYRTPFYEATAAELATPQDPEDEDYEGDDTRDVIIGVALRLTRSLNFGGYGGNDAPAFSPQRHTKHCDCGSAEIDVGSWQGKQKRCWNVEWWDAEQKRAKADKKKREKRQAEKVVQAAGELGGIPMLDASAFHKRFGYSSYGTDRKYEEVARHDGGFGASSGYGDGDVFDPAVLDRASLIVRHDYGDRYQLCTTDVTAVRKAREQFKKQLAERGKAETSKRNDRDLAIARAPTDWHDSTIVVRTLLSFARLDKLTALAKELGFKPKAPGFGQSVLGDLTPEQMMDTVHVAVLRSVQADRREVLLVDDMVHREMAAPFEEQLRALIPWDPGAQPADDDLVDEAEDEAADDEAEELEEVGA